MLAIGVVVGVIAVGSLRPSAPAGFESTDLVFPEGVVLGLGNAPSIAVSRDGTGVVAVFRDGKHRWKKKAGETDEPPDPWS